MNCGVFFCTCYTKYYFYKNIDPKNQVILFSLRQTTNPIFFAVLPVDQKINLVSTEKNF